MPLLKPLKAPDGFRKELAAKDRLEIPHIQYMVKSKDPAGDCLLELFHWQCIQLDDATCGSLAVCIHEVIPKSLDADYQRLGNRVPLCAACHDWAHENERESRITRKLFERQLQLGIPDEEVLKCL